MEAALSPTGNVAALQPSSTAPQPKLDMPSSPSGTAVNEQHQPKPRYDATSSAARVNGIAGTAGSAEAAAKELDHLPARTPAAAKLNEQLQSKPRYDVLTTDVSIYGHASAVETASHAQGHAGTHNPQPTTYNPNPNPQPHP